MTFDDKFLERLRSQLNIVDVVSGYCPLTRKGGSYWACCPLPGHSEKTPSFAVNEAGQFYKCFGCGKGGDVIRFIMEMESLGFQDAVKLLCERAHIPLPENADGKDEEKTRVRYAEKTRLQALMRDVALFYVDCLKTPQCAQHGKYLEKRGLTKKEVTAFGLGASPDYDSLVKYLHKKGYTMQEALSVGAVQRRKGRDSDTKGESAPSENVSEYFDALAGRLIFPIIDGFGKVIAFGGRMLEKTDFGKYKNTSDSRLFSKRKTLYNLNNLKKEKNLKGKLDYAIMVEGYMDTIALYKAGFKNVVASMGTSLTIEQARMLKRYTDVVLICYDGDKAGQNATVRGLEILRDCGLEVRVVTLPDGLDPDELINQRGAGAYEELLNAALPLIDFKLQCVKAAHDITTVSGKRRYVEESVKVIGECENSAVQEELLKRLRDESGITYESLRRDLDKGANKATTDAEFAEKTPLAVGDVDVEGFVRAERFILDSFIRGESYVSGMPADFPYSDDFREEIAEYLSAKLTIGAPIERDKLRVLAGEERLEELMRVLESVCAVDEGARGNYFDGCKKLLLRRAAEAELTDLKNRYQSENDVAERKALAARINELTLKLAKLRR